MLEVPHEAEAVAVLVEGGHGGLGITCHVSQYCHVSGYLGQRHGAVVHGDRGGHHELGEVAEAARAEDVQDALRGDMSKVRDN